MLRHGLEEFRFREDLLRRFNEDFILALSQSGAVCGNIL
jgi:hypothetical protein